MKTCCSTSRCQLFNVWLVFVCFQSTPLSDVLAQLSVILKVPPPRLLLLREEVELPTDATVSELGLGIADIIGEYCHCLRSSSSSSLHHQLCVYLFSQLDSNASCRLFVSFQDAPLGSIFSQYLSRMSPSAQRKVRFHFDGSKVADSQTPAQLDMEDGDIVEVWI
uniref:NFATC2-interacting protein n=1 Tax=Seriola lalandi dorsalis TaxID=1841481 RepID=A0A3B4XIV0_SERLL